MKRKIMYALILLLLVLSCRKEQQKATTTTAPGTTLSLEQVKAFYKSDTTSNLSWDKATNNTGTKIPYWLVPLNGRPRFQNLGLGYRQMAFYIDSSKNINARIIETIPDATYLQRKQQVSGTDFTGRIFVYDTNYRLLYGKVYLNGKQIGRIRPTVADDKPVKVEMTAPVTECFWAADNYVDGNGNAVIYSEQICSTSYIDLGGGGGGDGSSGGPDPVNSQADLPPKGNGSGASVSPKNCLCLFQY